MSGEFKNSKVILIGEIISKFQFDHECFGEKFYTAMLASERLSGQKDIIPIMVSDRLVDTSADWTGRFVEVLGQLRSHNKYENKKNRLVLSVFVTEIEEDWIAESGDAENSIFLDGYICKPPIYRKTPLGREIADLLVAVNRPYGKSDYIPCICWGRNARFADRFGVGTHLELWGRIQSREYRKRISETERETGIAYEVSVSKLEVVEYGQSED